MPRNLAPMQINSVMADSPSALIPLGRSDLFRRTPSVSVQDGRIKFLPGTGTHGEFDIKDAAFPAGASLEYRVEKGDKYFDGDHGMSLGRTLWVIEPDGSRSLLATGFVLFISLKLAAGNLEKHGIPLRAVSFYRGKDGRIVENEISILHSGARFTTAVFLGFSNLWLGIIAGLFVHRLGYLVAIGTVAFTVLAVAGVYSAASRRTGFLNVISTLPSYAAGYAVAVVFVRLIARR
jgi:hypothetical protein